MILAGLVAPVVLPDDMSPAIVEAMAHVSARCVYVRITGDVAERSERVAGRPRG